MALITSGCLCPPGTKEQFDAAVDTLMDAVATQHRKQQELCDAFVSDTTPNKHELHSNKTARVTSDCGKMQSLGIEWP